MKSRRHPVRRRRETSPRQGTGTGRLLRESPAASRTLTAAPDARSPPPLAQWARYEGDRPTALTDPAGKTTLHSCCGKVAPCGVCTGERPSVGADADRRRRGRQAPAEAVQAARRDRRNDRRNGVGSSVDPYRLGDTMTTRTIAIAALVIAVVIVVVLFVI